MNCFWRTSQAGQYAAFLTGTQLFYLKQQRLSNVNVYFLINPISPNKDPRRDRFTLTWGGRGRSIARTRPHPRIWWGAGWCSGSSDWSGWGDSTTLAPRRRSAASPGRPRCSPGPSCRSRRRRSGRTPPRPGSSAAAPFPPPSSLPHVQWSLGHSHNMFGGCWLNS